MNSVWYSASKSIHLQCDANSEFIAMFLLFRQVKALSVTALFCRQIHSNEIC